MKLVVLEGPEKVGKTTLARKIVEDKNTSLYVHNGRDNSTPSRLDQQIQVLNHIPGLVVFDRWYPSEYIYSKLQSREPSYSPKTVNRLEKDLGYVADFKFILSGVSVSDLMNRRANNLYEADADVDVAQEVFEYEKYATLHDWIYADAKLIWSILKQVGYVGGNYAQ